MILGYARVSTQDQDLGAQLEALKISGAENIYQEKISGIKTLRPALRTLLENLRAGDTLLVTRLDRLARSTLDLLSILKRVSEVGATFKSLADTWADTTTPHGRLMLTVLGGLAEFERELIKARTGEGRRRAMAAGIRFGRPFKLSPEQEEEIIKLLIAGKSQVKVAKEFKVSRDTVQRLQDRGARPSATQPTTGANNSGGTLHPTFPGSGPQDASHSPVLR